MPMLSNPDQLGLPSVSRGYSNTLQRQPSNDSISTDLYDGPVSEEIDQLPVENSPATTLPSAIESRQELIQRIKRSQSPLWERDRKVRLFHQFCHINPYDCFYSLF
jgi:hypothetical protein